MNLVRVIDSKAHREEAAKVVAVANFTNLAIHIGSTGIQLLVRDPTGKVSSRIAPTQDADIILRQSEAETLAKKIGGSLDETQLIANSQSWVGVMKRITRYQEDPFKLFRISSEYEPMNALLENMDIFTERTGVGPIPITDYVLNNGYETVMLGELNIRVAKPFFLIATQANPFARTEERMDRLTYLMLDTFDRNPDAYRSEVEMAIQYIGYGGLEAKRAAVEHEGLSVRAEFREYDSKVRQIGDLVGRQKRKQIYSIAQQMNISERSANESIEITRRLFSEYETPSGEMSGRLDAEEAKLVRA